jgi:putative ABC transport system substrate-binding protein
MRFGRRRLLGLLGGSFAAAALPAFAQQAGKIYRIGLPIAAPRASLEHLLAAFEESLRDYGYVNGKNIVIDYRFGDGKLEGIPELVQDLLRSKVDILVTGTNPTTSVAKAATRSVPIVMWVGTDVIGQGYVASLAKPGGNITGLSWDVGPEMVGKRLELLKEALPQISRVAALVDMPFEEAPVYRQHMQKVAALLRMEMLWFDVTDDFERTFSAAVGARADAIFPTGGARMWTRRAQIVELAAKHRLAGSYYDAAFVDAGGLMSYAPNLPSLIRGTAKFIDRIIKGAKPGDLPVELPTKLDLVINLKAAKALGVTIPHSVLVRADRVIE